MLRWLGFSLLTLGPIYDDASLLPGYCFLIAFSADWGSVTNLICQACRGLRPLLSPLAEWTVHWKIDSEKEFRVKLTTLLNTRTSPSCRVGASISLVPPRYLQNLMNFTWPDVEAWYLSQVPFLMYSMWSRCDRLATIMPLVSGLEVSNTGIHMIRPYTILSSLHPPSWIIFRICWSEDDIQGVPKWIWASISLCSSPLWHFVTGSRAKPNMPVFSSDLLL